MRYTHVIPFAPKWVQAESHEWKELIPVMFVHTIIPNKTQATGYIGQDSWNFRHTDHFETSLQPYHIGEVTNSVHIIRVLEELYLALLQYLTMDSKEI